MDGTHNPTKRPDSLLAVMPMPNQRETENRKDKQAAARISQSALVNIKFASANALCLL
jgi:hypothetical protein